MGPSSFQEHKTLQARATSPAAAKAKPVGKREVATVIFGLDSKKKPHAASFTADETALAIKAAGLMGLAVWRVGVAGQALALKMPKGKIFGSGRAFTPLVSAKLMAELQLSAGPAAMPGSKATSTSGAEMPLAGAVEAGDGPSGASGTHTTAPTAEAPGGPLKRPTDWGSIDIGCEVLADAGEEGRGWFEAVTVAQPDTNLFELRWIDWPDEPAFVRRREDLALLSPQYVFKKVA